MKRSSTIYHISIFLILLLVADSYSQYQQQGGFQQRSGSFQQNGNFQQQGGAHSRYQQSHVIIPGPGPVSNNYGGQFREQRVINIQENIQGMSQQQGGGGGGGYAFGSGGSYGGGGGYQMMQGGQVGQYNAQNGQYATTTGVLGSQVVLQLISYTDTGLKLQNDTTCNCPISYCNFLQTNQQNQCQFSFVIVISGADQSIVYDQSNFFPVPTNGIINTGNWTNQHIWYLTTKPVSIDIFVQHLGVVISQTGQLLFFNHLTQVDSFSVDLTAFDGTSTQGVATSQLTGKDLQTTLQLSLSITCINDMLGPLCDLSCNKTNAVANQLVICFSNRTDTYSSCRWNTQLTQVTECTVCTHGQYNGTCAAGIIVNNTGVSSAFRVWTIVLGCLLGIALLLLLCLILSYIIARNRQEEVIETSAEYKDTYENRNYEESKNAATSRRYQQHRSSGDSGSDQPLVTNEEWTSTTASKRPVGNFTRRVEQQPPQQLQPPPQHPQPTREQNVRKVDVHHQQSSNSQRQQQHQHQNQNYQSSNASDYGGRRQQDSPDTEESYLANGQVQQTTTTTTTTTRREHIV